jgi:hypothetical protein
MSQPKPCDIDAMPEATQIGDPMGKNVKPSAGPAGSSALTFDSGKKIVIAIIKTKNIFIYELIIFIYYLITLYIRKKIM